MTHYESGKPDIALVRSFPEWIDRDYLEKSLVNTTDQIAYELVTKHSRDTDYVIADARDARLARTSFYLDRSMQDAGYSTQVVGSAELTELIMQSRLDADRVKMRSTLARIAAIAEDLAEWTTGSRLVLVTSEPFMIAARSPNDDDIFLTDMSPIEAGEVVAISKQCLAIE